MGRWATRAARKGESRTQARRANDCSRAQPPDSRADSGPSRRNLPPSEGRGTAGEARFGRKAALAGDKIGPELSYWGDCRAISAVTDPKKLMLAQNPDKKLMLAKKQRETSVTPKKLMLGEFSKESRCGARRKAKNEVSDFGPTCCKEPARGAQAEGASTSTPWVSNSPEL